LYHRHRLATGKTGRAGGKTNSLLGIGVGTGVVEKGGSSLKVKFAAFHIEAYAL
jgi:hypothetical protein